MMYVRRSHERGQSQHGWLKSMHSFSFASYQDPQYMGWGNLRVVNEDRIAPGTGFGMHPHRDMEIVSYVVQGALLHADSLGHRQVIKPGDVQRMTAGTGVMHSEHGDVDQATHFLQIWLLPSSKGLPPSYEQKHFAAQDKTNVLRLVAAPGGVQGSVHLNADARIYAGLFRPQDGRAVQLNADLSAGRKAYVQVVQGEVEIAGQRLTNGDALFADNETHLAMSAGKDAEVLVFDLAS